MKPPFTAAVYLNEVLRERPANGPANLAMAAVEATRGRSESAVLHFQRAVVGTWPGDAVQERIQARIESVEYLAKIGRSAQARAELLALAANLPEAETEVKKRVGRMLLEFGMASSAADLFISLLKTGPADAAEYDGLGQAEFLMADYGKVRNAFRNALKIDPGDNMASSRAAICDKVLALDPTQPGLGSRERFRRSGELLRMVSVRLAGCESPEEAWQDSAKDLANAARATLSRKRSPASYSDAAEANTSLAVRLWSEQLKLCGPPPSDDPLALVMKKLAGVPDSNG